jgi:hypothetical protein
VAHGVFEEEGPDRYRLNAAAELLRRDLPGSQRAGVLFAAGDTTWRLWSDFLASVRTGQAVVDRAFGKGIFQRFAERSDEFTLFGQAMAAFSAALSQPVIAAYDFSAFRCVAVLTSVEAADACSLTFWRRIRGSRGYCSICRKFRLPPRPSSTRAG